MSQIKNREQSFKKERVARIVKLNKNICNEVK